jgi:arabinogalactan oligomer/maltooligosaccharide transport system permease protein
MNWTHTSTAAVAAKKSGAPNTAKIRKTVINVIVHIFLAILAFIWVLPIFWVILTSFRERFLCKYIFPENLYI